MSNVKRYWMFESSDDRFIPHIEVVQSSDYDAAQSELATLREELAEAQRHMTNNAQSAMNKHMEGLRYRDERDESNRRLTAAEQRNAELSTLLHTHTEHVAALCDVMFRFGLGMDKEPEQKIYAALAQQQVAFAALKPTESGASE